MATNFGHHLKSNYENLSFFNLSLSRHVVLFHCVFRGKFIVILNYEKNADCKYRVNFDEVDFFRCFPWKKRVAE